MTHPHPAILRFDQVTNTDVPLVGGKNASLGELVRSLGSAGVRVPPGFATTVAVYWAFVDANGLREVIEQEMARRDRGETSLAEAGRAIREAFLQGAWPDAEARALLEAYAALGGADPSGIAVAVRSSATAEDLPGASFAGQQDTYLNIRGTAALLDACRRCFASLFTDRAISYRETQGFDHFKVALSIGVQRMVRADLGGAGVMFSIDTDSGFDRVVLINAVWGLGESLVQGSVDPDEYQVFKPLLEAGGCTPIIDRKLGGKAAKLVYGDTEATRSEACSAEERARFVLTDAEVLLLARWACAIERHYGRPMDIEWARDGATGEMFVVQARPETVQSQRARGTFRLYKLTRKGAQLATGLAIGDAIVTGTVCRIESARDVSRFVPGAILVTRATDPDWGPIMKQAAAIVTDHGGRTSHAAIVSREMGLPALVGTGNATAVLADGQTITVSCAEGDHGFVYAGIGEFEVHDISVDDIPATRTKVMLNLANPATAFRWWRLPADGVGLARMEFVVNDHVRIHPMALVHYDTLEDAAARAQIDALTHGYADKTEYFVERLARGLARIAAVLHPHPVIVRMSDFKTNEYANLIGGAGFEPPEENPMLGFRGASRYYSPRYREGFALECRAIRKLREVLGFRNVIVMIPFCRTLGEADQVLAVMAEEGLRRGTDGLQIYMMCEIPANVVLAEQFAERFDGFSIGSNDLTQLTLGVDRDAGELADLFDEQDPAVAWMIRTAIAGAHARGIKIGLCGQAPSDHPAFAGFLVGLGIDSMSVSPDSFITVKRHVADAERRQDAAAAEQPTGADEPN
jgi:pyruvate, water dikinase